MKNSLENLTNAVIERVSRSVGQCRIQKKPSLKSPLVQGGRSFRGGGKVT